MRCIIGGCIDGCDRKSLGDGYVYECHGEVRGIF
jgi:hypothetical protein